HLHGCEELSSAQLEQWRKWVEERHRRRPLAYIIGSWDFMGLHMKVDERTIVPRPETEQLVELVLQQLDSKVQRSIIADVGTGCGAIAIALALKLPHAHILAIDVSEEALSLARENARMHNVQQRITFLQGSILEPLEGYAVPRGLKAIVANLPYVADDEIATLPPEVRQYEPTIGWSGGKDGLKWVRQLIAQASYWLQPDGILALEVGTRQARRVEELLECAGAWTAIEIYKDYAHIERFVTARRRS
ncbi:MAG TPA: peptide chain release factor N(5)-glutamine methyltransferase, partial [Armatimonadetes bacterium]|nr:peptide chain release factor N(5)-glutamine methyltransferase [Armatimonadota bacterium]